MFIPKFLRLQNEVIDSYFNYQPFKFKCPTCSTSFTPGTLIKSSYNKYETTIKNIAIISSDPVNIAIILSSIRLQKIMQNLKTIKKEQTDNKEAKLNKYRSNILTNKIPKGKDNFQPQNKQKR